MDSTHHEGMTKEDHAELMEKMGENAAHYELEDHLRRAQLYLSHKNMVGCYVKMLNGYECHSSFLTRDGPFNQTALNAAVTALHQFYFVGILEEYEQSLTLLHRMANVGTSVHPVELMKVRKQQNRNLTTYLYNHLNYTDPYDDYLYAEGKMIFRTLQNLYK
jgi:hypothetical protein